MRSSRLELVASPRSSSSSLPKASLPPAAPSSPRSPPYRPRPVPGSAALFSAAEAGDLRKLEAALAAGTPVDITDQRPSPAGLPTLLTCANPPTLCSLSTKTHDVFATTMQTGRCTGRVETGRLTQWRCCSRRRPACHSETSLGARRCATPPPPCMSRRCGWCSRTALTRKRPRLSITRPHGDGPVAAPGRGADTFELTRSRCMPAGMPRITTAGLRSRGRCTVATSRLRAALLRAARRSRRGC